MKINKEKLRQQLEDTIDYGAAHCEETDVTTNKVWEIIQPLLIAVEEL